jgi:diguanylate cyclase (GGDEF)-like protein
MAAHGETIGLLHLSRHGPSPSQSKSLISDATQRLSVAVGTEIALSLTNLELRETLRRQALRDPLTGLYNRRFVDDWIEREVNRADHVGTSLGVLMADVDHFKQVNDIHGHDAGDQVLVAVSDAIRGSVRAGDVPCRYGGEEFLVLFTDINLDDLLTRADALRATIERLHVEDGARVTPTVTVSVGVALYPQHGAVAADVVKAADTALYAAKRAGRNRVVVASTD